VLKIIRWCGRKEWGIAVDLILKKWNILPREVRCEGKGVIIR
jgi:hypothetical protein